MSKQSAGREPAQPKLVGLESAGASALHPPPYKFNPGDRNLTGRGVLTSPPFVGPLCRSVGAQSTAHRFNQS